MAQKIFVDVQNETLKRENETLTREIAEWREMYNDLKRSLDDAVKRSSQHTRRSEPVPETHPDISNRPGVDELCVKLRQKDEQLKKTVRQLNETTKQLSEAREQLAVSREVAKATKIRELQQEGIYENLVADNIYVNLRQDRLKEDSNPKPQQTSQIG